MKKYIFMIFAVFGIGGTQIYVRNKLNFLKKQGWDVCVITTESPGKDGVVVKELLPYQNAVFPELMNNPNLYTKKEREAIINRLCTVIGDITPESVIESNFIQVTFWGELLAKRFGIRHFVFLIQEDYRIRIKNYLEFFKFKYDRGELAVNTKQALKILFDGYCSISKRQNAFLDAFCHNAVEDCVDIYTPSLPKADFVIGSAGRVNKPFVLPMIRQITEFAMQHPKDTFLIVFMGGSPEKKDYEDIYEEISCTENLNVYITGPIFPIPFSLMKYADAYVSSAGSARMSAEMGFTTIAMDGMDYLPIGIVGKTTNDTIHRPVGQKVVPLDDLLEQVLYGGKYTNQPYLNPQIEEDIQKSLYAHFEFLKKADESLEYYDISKIKPALGLRLKEMGRKLKGRCYHK